MEPSTQKVRQTETMEPTKKRREKETMEPKSKKRRTKTYEFPWKCSVGMIPLTELSSIKQDSCRFICKIGNNMPEDPQEPQSVDYSESEDDDDYYGDDVIDDAMKDLKTPGGDIVDNEDDDAYYVCANGSKYSFTRTSLRETTLVPIFVFSRDTDNRWYGICYARLTRGQQPTLEIIIVDKLLCWSLPVPNNVTSIISIISSDHAGVIRWPRCHETHSSFVNDLIGTGSSLATMIKLTNLVGSEWSSMSSTIKYYYEHVLKLSYTKDKTCGNNYILSELLRNEMNTFAPGISLQIHK